VKQFEIFINNRPGELARVTEVLGANGINIVAIASERTLKSMVRIITDDERSTRSALNRAKFEFEERQLIILNLTDRPGELAKIAKKLAKRGVNVDSIHILNKESGTTTLAIVVDDNEKAKEILRV